MNKDALSRALTQSRLEQQKRDEEESRKTALKLEEELNREAALKLEAEELRNYEQQEEQRRQREISNEAHRQREASELRQREELELSQQRRQETERQKRERDQEWQISQDRIQREHEPRMEALRREGIAVRQQRREHREQQEQRKAALERIREANEREFQAEKQRQEEFNRQEDLHWQEAPGSGAKDQADINAVSQEQPPLVNGGLDDDLALAKAVQESLRTTANEQGRVPRPYAFGPEATTWSPYDNGDGACPHNETEHGRESRPYAFGPGTTTWSPHDNRTGAYPHSEAEQGRESRLYAFGPGATTGFSPDNGNVTNPETETEQGRESRPYAFGPGATTWSSYNNDTDTNAHNDAVERSEFWRYLYREYERRLAEGEAERKAAAKARAPAARNAQVQHAQGPCSGKSPPQPMKSGKQGTTSVCYICGDKVERQSSLIMGCAKHHAYCRDCLVHLCKSAISDSATYPAKCCGTALKLSPYVIDLLGPEVITEYRNAGIRFGDKNRTFCHKCGKYLERNCGNKEDQVRHCKDCAVYTCTKCGERAHPGRCEMRPLPKADSGIRAAPMSGEPQNRNTAVETTSELEKRMRIERDNELALHKLAKDKQWVRCPFCNAMIEPEIGACPHTSCRCGKEVCVICGVRWGNCRHASQWQSAHPVPWYSQWDNEVEARARKGRTDERMGLNTGGW